MAKANKYIEQGNYEMALHFLSIVLDDARRYNGDDMSVIMYAASASDKYAECQKLLNIQKELNNKINTNNNTNNNNKNDIVTKRISLRKLVHKFLIKLFSRI